MGDTTADPNAVDLGARLTTERRSLAQFRTQPTPSGLWPAEDQLLLAAISGQDCKLGDGTRPEAPDDPARYVRGSFLRFLAMGGDETVRPDARGVVLVGAYVGEQLYLVGAHCTAALQLSRCCFAGRIALDYAHIPLLMLDGSSVPGIAGDLAQIGGVFLRYGFLATGPVRFYSAQIAGNLDARGATFRLPDRPKQEDKPTAPAEAVLICSNAQIGGDVNLSKDGAHDFQALGQIRLANTKIGGSLTGDGGNFDNGDQTALLASSVSVGGNVSLWAVRIAGTIDLRRASIRGTMTVTIAATAQADEVSFEPADLTGPDVWRGDDANAPAQPNERLVFSRRVTRPIVDPAKPERIFRGLLADDIDVSSSVTLRGSLTGPIQFDGAHIGGDLDCRGSTLDGYGEPALSCVNARIDRTLMLQNLPGVMAAKVFRLTRADLFQAHGQVNLAGSTVGGAVICAGGSFSNRGGEALNFAKARMGSVDLGTQWLNPDDAKAPLPCLGAAFDGLVNFGGAVIAGDLDCSGGRFEAVGAVSLFGAGAQIGGSVNLARQVSISTVGERRFVQLSDPFQSKGLCTLAGVTIGLNLNGQGSRFENDGEIALEFSNARIKGSANLACWFFDTDTLAFCFTSRGTVNLYGADIAGNLECGGARLICPGNVALAAAGVHTGGTANFCQASQNGRFGPRFTASGSVDLTAADVGSYLQCFGGSFARPGGLALGASGIAVGGSVFLSKAQASDATTAGAASAGQQSPAPFEADGIVDFKYANIKLVMICQGGHFTNRAPDRTTPSHAALALDLRAAQIDTLQLGTALPGSTPATIEGSIDLSGAHVIQLLDEGFVGNAAHFPPTVESATGGGRLDCVMVLDGFTYDRLGGDSSSDARTRKAWLDRQPAQHLSQTTFRPQPFDQLGRVLRAMGQDDEARDIAVNKQRRKTALTPPDRRVLAGVLFVAMLALGAFAEQSGNSFVWLGVIGCAVALYYTKGFGWLSRSALGALADYGYSPTRVLIVALILGVGLGLMFKQAAEQGVFIPVPTKDAPPPAGCGPDWTQCAESPFPPLVYAFDTMLPLKLGEAEKWTFQRKPFQLHLYGWHVGVADWVIAASRRVAILYGWVASGIILALITGMLKKD
jgi:hypothetical protein